MTKPIASLSLDLDNLWSYLKVHGDEEWKEYPSYLDAFIPIILDLLKKRGLTITFFVVGQDAMREKNRGALRALAEAGHEIGNHSVSHESWMHTYGAERVESEIGDAERAIESATGHKPVGFRGPGFAYSPTILKTLTRRGYLYDASLLPSSLGPVARAYYMWRSNLSGEERKARSNLFGKLSDGFHPLRPFEWETGEGPLIEIPVTTMPMLRFPFHLSYVIWLSRYSRAAAMSYLRTAIALCRLKNVAPSYLLHPLDFLGCEDVDGLEFFPGMDRTREHKLGIVERMFDLFQNAFEAGPMISHANRAAEQGGLKRKQPSEVEE